MSFKATFLMMVGASVVAAACTRQPQGIQVQPAPTAQRTDPGAAQPATQADGARVVAAVPSGSTPSASGSSGSVTTGDTTTSGAVGMTLKKSDFASYDASNLSYSFNYLGRTASDRIVFDASNQAVIKITSLPSGQAGTVSLSILQNGAAIMQGTQDNVVLTAGLNNVINLKLKALGTGGGVPGSTTDLTIDVAMDNNTQLPTQPGQVISNPTTPPGSVITNPPTTGGSTPPGTVVNNPPVTNNPGPVVQPPVTTQPTIDPLASWDGKSFLGNSRWNIVPVQ